MRWEQVLPRRAFGLLASMTCLAACSREHAAFIDPKTRPATPAVPAGGASNGLREGTREQPRPAPLRQGALSRRNSSDRTGSYLLPAGFDLAPRPVMLAFHGTDQSGADMVSLFRNLAIDRTFIIIAPDSRSIDGHYNWEVGDGPGQITEDYAHAMDCFAEVRAMPDVQFDDSAVLAVGFSGGGSSAPYLSTNERLFEAFAVLHGGVIQGGIGAHLIPGWFSTGDADPARPPALVQQSVDYIKSLGFTSVKFMTYPAGHEVSSDEAADVVTWWRSLAASERD